MWKHKGKQCVGPIIIILYKHNVLGKCCHLLETIYFFRSLMDMKPPKCSHEIHKTSYRPPLSFMGILSYGDKRPHIKQVYFWKFDPFHKIFRCQQNFCKGCLSISFHIHTIDNCVNVFNSIGWNLVWNKIPIKFSSSFSTYFGLDERIT